MCTKFMTKGQVCVCETVNTEYTYTCTKHRPRSPLGESASYSKLANIDPHLLL